MSKSSRTRGFKIKTFSKALQGVISSLPTESEKQEIQESYVVLIDFLNDLKDKLNSLPSAEDMEAVKRTIDKVEDLLIRAETNPSLGVALGLRRKPLAKGGRPEATEDESLRARRVLDTFESLSVDEIELRLANEHAYSVRELRAIASVLGVRPTKGLDRLGLLRRITTKIANYRGYQSLSGSIT